MSQEDKIKLRLLQAIILFVERTLRGLRRRLRNLRYRMVLKEMGKDCSICDNVFITTPEYTSLGEHVTINEDVILQSCEGAAITIGNDVTISYGAYLITGGVDLLKDVDCCEGKEKHTSSSIIIEDSVWIAARAIILPGVTIGSGATVAAGAVVTRDVEPNTLVAGIPAKPIRKLEPRNNS